MFAHNVKSDLLADRFRVIVSTDIGGSDPDDFQSMVHYLLYSDLFDTEGLLSSPWGDGRKEDIFAVIDAYEADYPVLKTWSQAYPSPEALRCMCHQGAISFAPWKGWSVPTEASEHIIACAKKADARPLYILVWGLLEDVAQALHDAPEIAPKLRVVYIGGPNKKWGANAYAYIYRSFPDLWIIENNSTYRGWFNGGDMSGPYGNGTFVQKHIAGHGALGAFFKDRLPAIKMGDTPTVAYLLSGTPEDPAQESWGGSFAAVSAMPMGSFWHKAGMNVLTEVFAVAEIYFRAPDTSPAEEPVFAVEIRGQLFDGFCIAPGVCAFRFVPKETGDFAYVTHSGHRGMDGLRGLIHVTDENPAARINGSLTHWYSDRLDPAFAEGPYKGAGTVSKWRRDFLDSFADRFEHCRIPKK